MGRTNKSTPEPGRPGNPRRQGEKRIPGQGEVGVKASGGYRFGYRPRGLGPAALMKEWGPQSDVCIREEGRGEVTRIKPRRTGPAVNRGLEKPCPLV